MTNQKHTAPEARKGRPRRGSLEFRKGSWQARLTVTVDGESVRRWFNLGTESQAAARRKLTRLVRDQSAAPNVATVGAEAVREETYQELAGRVLKLREQDGLRDLTNERGRESQWILPAIGTRSAASIGPEDINAIFDAMREAGRARETIVHVKNILNGRFKLAWREGAIRENPVARAVIPKARVDRRERAVLTDDELARYLGWTHPDERQRMAVLERQTMACISRMFGGLRTGDLHALRWEALDATGDFEFGWAPRKKTARPQKLVIPEMLRPILRDWWERHGRLREGLVFPVRRGDSVGEARRGVSHAEAFRRDLRRAFGLDKPERVFQARRNGRPNPMQRWTAVRPLTPREQELFEETVHTRPVDFHSWRRAYVQALADAEVNAQQAAALAGHASLAAHGRYLANTAHARELPAAALPSLTVQAAASKGETFAPAPAETPTPQIRAQPFLAPPTRFERVTFGLGSRERAHPEASSRAFGRGRTGRAPS